MTCKVQKIKTNYYLPEKCDIADYNVDQTVIVKQDFLKFVSLYKKQQTFAEISGIPDTDDWYPYVNSYYPYTEDVDAFARVSHLLGSKPSFASLSSVECQYDGGQDKVPYSESAAQLKYLESNPLCFIILGKPGIGEEDLGRQLADYWQCVYIDPKILIEQEINIGNRAGQCIEFNLRCGRAIGIDVILRLVEKRIKSESAKHRGFVICGLPLIPNDLYKEDPISSESAVFTVREIFDEMFDTTMEEAIAAPSKPQVSVASKYKSQEDEVESDEEVVDEQDLEDEEISEESPTKRSHVKSSHLTELPLDTGPDYDICQVPKIGTNFEDQLNFIFDLMRPPFMIIYIMCSSADVVEKRRNYRFDVDARQTINMQTEIYNNLLFNYFSQQLNENEEIPEDFLEPGYINIDTSILNHMVKLPRHFPANVSTQLDSFHYAGLNFIDVRALMHDPQYFIKVDGRVSIQRMLNIIKSRLKILPVQQVILPSRLTSESYVGEGEGHEFQTTHVGLEKWYREFNGVDVPSSVFKWTWSDWGTKCPVALKEGTLKDGDPNYAVHFMNKMFFLADEGHFLKFYRNPRPYLLPPYPKPTCKIFVFGPAYSGKTSVSRCLSYLLNGTVLSIVDMVAAFLIDQAEELKEKIRQAAIAEALQILNEQRAREAEELESQRVGSIKQWVTSTKELIIALIKIIEELGKEQTVTSFELSSFPMAMKRISLLEAENPTTIEFSRLKSLIGALQIPLSEKLDDWYSMLEDKRKLLMYLPAHLRTKVVPKPATVFDEFVIQYAKNAVANADLRDASIDNKNMANIIISHIRTVEDEQVQQGNNRGGWILDGMLCDLALINEMYPDFIPDEVIILLDEEHSNFLVDKYQSGEKEEFGEYREFFMSIGKYDAAWRSPSHLPRKSSAPSVAHEILSEIINDSSVFDYHDDGPLDKVELYRQEVAVFNQKWKEVKHYFVQRNVQPIEVKVTDKSVQVLMEDVIKSIEDRYRVKASLYTELDRAEEVKNFGNQMLEKDVSEGVEVDGAFERNRRYGDTHHYCPVTFHDKWVLWKGKEDNAVKFENKLYLLSSDEDMKKFLQFPRNYLPGEPPETFPPPRICIIGIPGTGKTVLAKALARNYGLLYVNFETLLRKAFRITGMESLDNMRRSKVINAALLSYLNDDLPLPEHVLKDRMGIPKFWFEQPTMGFVLDDFPKRPSDIKFMTKHKLIPDIVIHLTGNAGKIKKKLVEKHLNLWHADIDEKRRRIEKENAAIRLEWEKKRSHRFEELIEVRRERRYASKKKEKEHHPGESPADRSHLETLKEVDENADVSDVRSGSQVSFDSVAEQDDINETNEILNLEFPEPLFEDLLESTEDATDRFEALATDTIHLETIFLKIIKTACIEENIPFNEVAVNFEAPEITTRTAFVIMDRLKFRSKSFFERSYEVSMEVAERLLSCGYLFLSKFGKTCPVQYCEDKNPVQMYLPMERKHNLFPVIHRSHIYYLVGRENQMKFMEDPLKYISVESFRFPLIPFKVAVIGPPKCGKTVLANRIADEYGFKVITRGQAARYLLNFLPLSDLAKNMESVLRKGWELTDELVMKCVEAASFDSRAVTQGIILDGFPNTITEVRHLSYVALVPNLAADLQATDAEIFECLSNDVGRRDLPRYSDRFVEHLLIEWKTYSETFREWFDREYQLRAKIPISTSNWFVWSQSRKYITAMFFEIKHYFAHVADDWPLRLANMQITPLEFLERQGAFKTYCPCCLHYSNSLSSGGEPPDRNGLVQYRQYFYWICPEHIEAFLKTPDVFMIPYNNHTLPQNLPVVAKLSTAPDNLEDTCVVCYNCNALFTKGKLQYAVALNNKTYLFDSDSCMQEFLRGPHKYTAEIIYKPLSNYPALNYKDLPVIGMLEQYVAKYVTKAVSFVERRRPIIPGLSVKASALVGVGLYLKIFNPNLPEDLKPFYEEADALYHDRRTRLTKYLTRMKSVINPYLHYEEPLPKFEMPVSLKSVSTQSTLTVITKIVDEIVDNVDCGT